MCIDMNMMSEYSILRTSTDESPKPTLCMLTAVDATLSIRQVRVYKQWGFKPRTRLKDIDSTCFMPHQTNV